MKDSLNDIDTRNAIHQETTKDELTRRLFHSEKPHKKAFVISKFPKEFKKSLLSFVDIRFLSILILSFLVHLITLLYLEKRYPSTMDSETITKIQQQYVDLLLEDKMIPSMTYNRVTTSNLKVEPLDSKTISGLNEWVAGFADNALEEIKDLPGFKADKSPPAETKTKETSVRSKEELSNARRSAAKSRLRSRTELENEVSNIGLLGLIGSKTMMRDHEYIDDLLEYTELNADHLASVLSKLNSIKVPRHNTAGYILKYKSGAKIGGGEIKGGRYFAENDRREMVKNIAPLETAKETKMKRTAKIEEVPSDPLAKLRAQTRTRKTRSAKDVVRVVQSHKRALQDCYKQELKVNPTVHGKIVVRFTIDPDGNVINAAVVSSTLNSPRMENCIVRRIKNWRNFGQCDPSLGNVTYKQVFNFGK